MVLEESHENIVMFPISRDPPEGGTSVQELRKVQKAERFPISRDPPEGGTSYKWVKCRVKRNYSN